MQQKTKEEKEELVQSIEDITKRISKEIIETSI